MNGVTASDNSELRFDCAAKMQFEIITLSRDGGTDDRTKTVLLKERRDCTNVIITGMKGRKERQAVCKHS